MQPLAGASLIVREPVLTLGQLVETLGRLVPGLAETLEDPLYNFAVNDELLLHNVDARPIRDGDVIEIVPSMAGG